MNIKFLIKQSEKFVGENAPAILSGAAIAGTLATGYFAAHGMYKAANKIWHEDFQRGLNKDKDFPTRPPLTTTEKVKMAWLDLLPAVGAGAATIGCIVCANHITTKRMVAMAATYSLSEGKFKEYKTAIEKKLGIEQAQEIEKSIVSEKVAHGPATMIVLGEGDLLCFDAYSGRYFYSTKSALDKAANEINVHVIKDNFQTLDDFWDLVGMEATAYGQEQGWTVDCPLELTYTTMMSSDDKPCLVVHYDVEPLRRWNHIG